MLNSKKAHLVMLVLLFGVESAAMADSTIRTIELGGAQLYKKTGTVHINADNSSTIQTCSSATYAFVIPPDNLASYSSLKLSVNGFNNAWSTAVWVQSDLPDSWVNIANHNARGTPAWEGPWDITNYRIDSSAVGSKSGMFSVVLVKLVTDWLNTFDSNSIKLEITYEPQIPFLNEWLDCMAASEACRGLSQAIPYFDVWTKSISVQSEEAFLGLVQYVGTLCDHLIDLETSSNLEALLSLPEILNDVSNIDFLLDFTYTCSPLIGLRDTYCGPAPISNSNFPVIEHGLANRLDDPDGIGSQQADMPNLAGLLRDWANLWKAWNNGSDTQEIMVKYSDIRKFFDAATVSYPGWFGGGVDWTDSQYSVIEHARRWTNAWSTMATVYEERAPHLAADCLAAANLGKEMESVLSGISELVDLIAMPEPSVNCKGEKLVIDPCQEQTLKFVVCNDGGYSPWIGLTISVENIEIVGYDWPNELPESGYEHLIIQPDTYQKDTFYQDTVFVGRATNYPKDYNSSDPHWASDPVNASGGGYVNPVQHQILEIARRLKHGETAIIGVTFRGTANPGTVWYRVAAAKQKATGNPNLHIYYPVPGPGIEPDQQGWYAFALPAGNDPPSKPNISLVSQTGRVVIICVSAIDPSNWVQYKVIWGDGSSSNWSELVPTGTELDFTHIFPGHQAEPYKVTVYAKDQFGQQSHPSDELPIAIPNSDPYQPKDPSPKSGETVPITTKLAWRGGDPDPVDTVTYDVYFGSSPSPPLVKTNISSMSYNPSPLAPTTKYYWMIVARDNNGATASSSVWNFTTGEVPDFLLVAAPEQRKIKPGQSAEFQIQVQPSGGFSSDVQLTVEAVSPQTDKLTWAFDTNPCPTGSYSILTITTTQNLPDDVYRVTIYGESGGLGQFLTVSVSVVTYLADWYVDDDAPNDPGSGTLEDPFRRIQDAINAASDGQVILVRDGTYIGSGNRDIDFLNKDIVVRSQNGPETTIIDCQASETEPHHAFYFHRIAHTKDSRSTLDGFKIINGYADKGGGILCERSSPTLANCILNGNTAQSGGGIYNAYGSPTLLSCTFTENKATTAAGMYNYSSGEGQPEPTPCDVKLINCIFRRNQAEKDGGGIYSWHFYVRLTNCVCTENSCGGNGGMIYSFNCGVFLTNCTFSGNSASKGNAVACEQPAAGYGSSIRITNSILWDSGSEIFNGDGSEITATYSCLRGCWPDSGNIKTDPLFADLNNGDYHLKSQAGRWNPTNKTWAYDDVTSPCIDAGNPSSPLGDETSSPYNVRIDMGAYGGTAEASKTPVDWSLLADLTNDGIVDFGDFAAQAKDWYQSVSEQPGDLNRDGTIDIVDLALFVEDWLARIQEKFPENFVLDLHNAGFEAGDLSHWSVTTVDSAGILIDSPGMTEGDYYAILWAGNGEAILSRTIELPGLGLYDVSFDYKSDPPPSVSVTIGSQSVNLVGDGYLHTYSMTMTVYESSLLSVVFKVSTCGDLRALFIDNFYICYLGPN